MSKDILKRALEEALADQIKHRFQGLIDDYSDKKPEVQCLGRFKAGVRLSLESFTKAQTVVDEVCGGA